MTAADHGATLVNYCPATSLARGDDGYITASPRATKNLEKCSQSRAHRDQCNRRFTDSIRRMAEPDAEPLVVASQGIHLVFDRSFLKGDTALMVPRTSDGRVLFVIPWHEHGRGRDHRHACGRAEPGAPPAR